MYHPKNAMNSSSAPAPSGISEFEYFSIETASSETVAPPRVAKALAALECRVTTFTEMIDIDGNKTGAVTIFGQVTGVYIDESVIQDGRFSIALAKPVTRLGYLDFGETGDIFELARPTFDGVVHNP